MKKLSVITILLTVLMSMVGTKSFAHDIAVANSGAIIYYVWTNNNTELAVSYRGSKYDAYQNEYSGNIVIPEFVTYNGNTYSVTSIGDYAFKECSNVISIELPNSVTSIGSYAFDNCNSLCSITIPNVTTMGKGAFGYNCDGLKVYISDLSKWCNIFADGKASSPNRGWRLYLNGEEITDLVIPDGVTTIGINAFSTCSSIESVAIPESVTAIDQQAFQTCSSLASVSIPARVTSIGWNAFGDCSNLKKIISLIQNPFDIVNDVFSNWTTATLFVPTGTKTVYKEKTGWKRFSNIVEAEQCAKPTISYNNGIVSFSCETEDVEFHYTISNTYPKGEGSQVPFLPRVCVYATKSGYADSDVAIAEIEFPAGLKGDLNNDGEVNVADHVELSKIIMNQDNIIGE